MLKFSLVLVVFAIVRNSFAVPNAKNAVIIGNFMYFTDVSQNWTRVDAVGYCEEQGGELAKIWNKDLYNQLRLAVRQIGSYWINGIDRAGIWRFAMNTTCSNYGEYWDLYGIPEENLNFPSISCLTLNKARTQAETKLSAINCDEQAFVLCQYPLDGCNTGNTMTTGTSTNIPMIAA